MVKVKILNEKGHEELDLSSQKALEMVKEQGSNGSWAFLDGVFQEAGQVTIREVRTVREIVITPALQAG